MSTIDIREPQPDIDTIVFADQLGFAAATRIKRYGQTIELENIDGDSKACLTAADIPAFSAAMSRAKMLGWY